MPAPTAQQLSQNPNQAQVPQAPAPTTTNSAEIQGQMELERRRAREAQDRAGQKQVWIYATGSIMHDGKQYRDEPLELPENEAKRLVDMGQATYGQQPGGAKK
jgi:hypothetical protein